ncbi:hypothetical protein H5410_062168 [Solanum commersonii]|uniref:Uncharacterized protein n=1 Tax=Solanum commersonii TaxID=4109 RepID=A0A9J5WA39_SOLCO|nr:hypothetical protein H5410_062168 [Solanum commersonii]
MTNSSSSSRLSVSQEIETPSSFKFSISPQEESLSTPACGVGETDEFVTPRNEVVASPALKSGSRRIGSSSKLGLSQKRHSTNLLEQELRSLEQVPHSAQLVFGQTSKSFDIDSEKDEKEDTPLVWRRKGVRGDNVVNLTVSDPEAIDVVPETKFDDELTESERKRKRKGKGKMVDSYTKGRRKRRYVTKVERVKAKGGPKSAKKSPVKKDKVNKRAPVKPKPLKGPGPSVQKPVEENVLIREECIAKVEKQKVLNERVFNPEILTKFVMSTLFYFVSLQSWEHLFEAPAPY